MARYQLSCLVPSAVVLRTAVPYEQQSQRANPIGPDDRHASAYCTAVKRDDDIMRIDDIKALCFDTGGTILDWHTGIRRAVCAVGTRHGMDRDWGRLANEFRRRSLKLIVNHGEHAPATMTFDDAVAPSVPYNRAMDSVILPPELARFAEEAVASSMCPPWWQPVSACCNAMNRRAPSFWHRLSPPRTSRSGTATSPAMRLPSACGRRSCEDRTRQNEPLPEFLATGGRRSRSRHRLDARPQGAQRRRLNGS